MVEEQCLDHRLREVDQVVVAADVRELVRDDGLQLTGVHAGDDGRRQHDDRLEVAENNRDRDAERGDHCDRSRDAQSRRKIRELRQTRLGNWRDADASKHERPPPAADEPDREEQNADRPDGNHPWHGDHDNRPDRRSARTWGLLSVERFADRLQSARGRGGHLVRRRT